MAALIAEWTVAARSNGGSPEAAKKSNNVKYVEPRYQEMLLTGMYLRIYVARDS